jgi:hypothetical protein
MKTIAVFLTLLLGLQAKAGVLLEPYLGYDTGSLKMTSISSGTDTNVKNTGTAFGAQIGYRFPAMFWIAADVASLSGTSKPDDVTQTSSDYTGTAMGVVLGYQWHILRFWGGYGFDDKFTLKGDATSTDTVFKGTNMKLGIGVMPVNHVSINFEYIVPKYTKADTSGLTNVTLADFYSKFDTTVMRLGVSFPFDFSGK